MHYNPRPQRTVRVLFDAFELAPAAGKSIGIYKYAVSLFQALCDEADPSIHFLLVCNPASAADFSVPPDRGTRIVLGDSSPSTLARQVWNRGRAAMLAKSLDIDIYFSPKGFLPYGLQFLRKSIKSIVVIHDLIPFWYSDFYPGYFGRLEEWVVKASLAHSIRNADSLIAISGATASDISARFGRTEGVSIVYNGVPISEPAPNLTKDPFIFAIASGLPHKNASGILTAYRLYRSLVEKPLPLILCGVERQHEPGVTFLKGISDSAVHGYYANARLFLFLSKIEGFGFPPVEAMAHGTQVLCSDIPCLREVTQNAAVYVPPDDVQGCAALIASLSSGDFSEKSHRFMEIASTYSWGQCAKGVLAALHNVRSRLVAD